VASQPLNLWQALTIALFSGTFGALFTAVIGPTLAELVRRRFLGPKLKFHPAIPLHHKVKTVNGLETFYVRVGVLNDGKTQAQHCEAIIEQVRTKDAAGVLVLIESFLPVRMIWDGADLYAAINPGRRLTFALGLVPDQAHERTYLQREGIPDNSQAESLRFYFDLSSYPLSQRSSIPPGSTELDVAVYSENTRTLRATFEVHWTGQWKAQAGEMQKELVVRRKVGTNSS
jgi:hypothetical protein